MKRKVILSALVLVLLLASLATALAVMAAKGAAPRMVIHDAGCLSYCARAIMYEDFDNNNTWEPWDVDEDGKVEICTLEGLPGVGEYMQCHKLPPGMCPEFDSDGDGVLDRCQLLSDLAPGGALEHADKAMRFACVLQHGIDTHEVTL